MVNCTYLVITINQHQFIYIFAQCPHNKTTLISGGSVTDEEDDYLRSIFRWDVDEWKPVGNMSIPRDSHAVEVLEDVSKYCP